jgi:hypothetical protein
MKRSNLIKGIVCGLMLTAVVGSTVFAGTVNRERFGYNVRNINDSYTGEVGVYQTVATFDVAGLKVVNNTGSMRYYTLECDWYNSITGSMFDFVAGSATLTPGTNTNKSIEREYDEPRYSYRLYGCGYYGTHTTSGLADKYTMVIDQYED